MNVLVSCDENYINPLKTMLYSLFKSNDIQIEIYLIHKDIRDEKIKEIEKFVEKASIGKGKLNPIKVEDLFSKAKTTFYYTEEMYYRLLAYKYLPKSLDRILYLDPDVLVLNSCEELYNMDLSDNYFAAATHTIPTVQSANVARLSLTSGHKDIENYFNSGILMINLELARNSEKYEKEVLNYVENSKSLGLIMPDQDLLNVVFRNKIIKIDEIKYNYDARRYLAYKLKDKKYKLSYIISNTCFLHFCGKRKPWLDENNLGVFTSLYLYFWKNAMNI
ncbi:glycosyltransferase family 8 protein [Anaerococcus hydrogenalis]|uniref:Glycosyltransferase family 8 protein n=1 Tax=Anaerococcus hydrogenalis TaxID=33029 RepID=A0A2N6UH38_9FIRM|nr:glycosyltransferase family 8 protein [Anaerococcus hydrogenalis]MDK7695732.1 glycosyltransferase family 8 protein [Anaerococcus hydrogenalis]MDK7697445.1 glycosyltransferase family 8 protein [Anaerococcus hydrogenalis]MDK7708712.1 glycosyltransferase family 8 protein [Anaerococcus hydrogenalis]PMC80852.1 glycosyltransferase family 8 protein [Anaerococcus hydrogenalis]